MPLFLHDKSFPTFNQEHSLPISEHDLLISHLDFVILSLKPSPQTQKKLLLIHGFSLLLHKLSCFHAYLKLAWIDFLRSRFSLCLHTWTCLCTSALLLLDFFFFTHRINVQQASQNSLTKECQVGCWTMTWYFSCINTFTLSSSSITYPWFLLNLFHPMVHPSKHSFLDPISFPGNHSNDLLWVLENHYVESLSASLWVFHQLYIFYNFNYLIIVLM